MKRLLLAVLVALALSANASAKELTGFKLCGPDGCAGGKLSGFGHQGPFDPAGGSNGFDISQYNLRGQFVSLGARYRF